MKFVEIPVFSHAIEREAAIRRIDNQAEIIKERLLKIILCDSAGTVNHWISEIQGFISPLKRIKLKSGAKLKANVIYDYLYDNNSFAMEIQIPEYIQKFLDMGYSIKTEYASNTPLTILERKIEKFYTELSSSLEEFYRSKKNFDVQDILRNSEII